MPTSDLLNRTLRTAIAAFLTIFVALSGSVVLADGTIVDKVYHPYVDAMESELEYRVLFQGEHSKTNYPRQIHRLSLGRSFGDRLFGEMYVVGEKSRAGTFDFKAYELEMKWQLTEQGEYSSDWGLLFEYENEMGRKIQEAAVGVLAEREFGRFSGTANFKVIAEFGRAIKDEVETVLATQLRYRHSRAFEPALEAYIGQDYIGAGPVALGQVNVGIRKNLSWEAGMIFGIEPESPDQTFRLQLEYEF